MALYGGTATAQTVAPLRFDAVSHDFGTIAEEGGDVEHCFRFENTGTVPVVIVAATVSCGCTKAEFSQKPVMPHGKGEIIVRFSPLNYPGVFARKIAIATSEGRLAEPLLVTGKVTPRKRTIAEQFPLEAGGGVRIDTNAHSFGYAEHGKSTSSSFAVVNTSGRTVTLHFTPQTASGFLYFSAPATLAPNERADINFGYRMPETCGKYGRLTDILKMEINGESSELPLIINAMAIDSRDSFVDTEEPRIVLSENFIKFGTLKGGIRSAEHTVELSNDGASALAVRAVESERGIADGIFEQAHEIPAGGSVRLRVRFTAPEDSFGAVTDRLTIISNDPQTPVRTLKVSAIVER